ncbi:hypothetical protein HG531_007976 [Fusarium graminearum]|nr:hypothetical protein HG531_007976 [Fusarium graminearum]
MATNPLQDGLDCVLIPGLQGISKGASVAESKQKGEDVKRRVVRRVLVKDQVQSTGISGVSPFTNHVQLLGGGDPTLALLFLSIMSVYCAGYKGCHFLLTLGLPVCFRGSKAGSHTEDTRLHTNSERARADQIENADRFTSSSKNGGSGWHGQDVLNRCCMLESHDGAVSSCSGVPKLDGRIVTSRDNHVGHGARHKVGASNIIGVANEGSGRVIARKIPKSDGLVVACTQKSGQLGRGELGGPYGLLVMRPCLEDGPGTNIKDLNLSGVVTCSQDPPIPSEFTTARNICEASDGLEKLARSVREYFIAALLSWA